MWQAQWVDTWCVETNDILTDRTNSPQFNNLVIRSLASGDENVKSFVICDVNKQAVSEIISEHKARNRRIRLEAASGMILPSTGYLNAH